MDGPMSELSRTYAEALAALQSEVFGACRADEVLRLVCILDFLMVEAVRQKFAPLLRAERLN